MPEAKSYVISKQVVWEAYQKVKANHGAAGVDGESIEAFEKARSAGSTCSTSRPHHSPTSGNGPANLWTKD